MTSIRLNDIIYLQCKDNGDIMPYKLDSEVIDRILDQNDIVDLIKEFLPLKKAGANYSTNCPFHNEKTPSFVVSPDKQIYHCFGCGESGNSINFLMKYRNYTFVEAVEYLAKRAGIILEETTNKNKINNNGLNNRLYEINRAAASFFYKNLKNSPTALNYLSKRRIKTDIIKRFGIGYALNGWSSLLNYLLINGYSREEILKTGLIIKSENKNNCYDRFRNRIIFPIIDVKKRIIGFGGRVLDDSLPKYLNSPESLIFSKGHNLFGLNIAKNYIKDNGFILVEGYMDVIKMHAYGYNMSVAALGTSLTDNQIKLLKRYSKKFYIAFDSDSAGKKASLKAINMFKKNNLDSKVIIIPDAKDPDEFLNKFGKINFDKLIENSLDYYSFLELYYDDIYKNSNKVEYINKFFDNIVNITSDIEKELIFEKLSKKVGVSKESIIKEYYKKNNKQKNYASNAPPVPVRLQVNKITTSHEEELLKLILLNNDFVLYLKEIVNENTFEDLEYYNIFKKIYEYKINNKSIDIESLKQILGNKMDVSVFVQDDNVDYNNLEALFKDCMKRLKIKYYEKKKTILTNNIKQQSYNDIQIENMMNEIFSLAKKIKSTKEEVN